MTISRRALNFREFAQAAERGNASTQRIEGVDQDYVIFSGRCDVLESVVKQKDVGRQIRSTRTPL